MLHVPIRGVIYGTHASPEGLGVRAFAFLNTFLTLSEYAARDSQLGAIMRRLLAFKLNPVVDYSK